MDVQRKRARSAAWYEMRRVSVEDRINKLQQKVISAVNDEEQQIDLF